MSQGRGPSPGNKFWKALFETGLTPRQLAPAEYRELLDHGVGLTDIAKGQSGTDDDIDFEKAFPFSDDRIVM